MKLLKPISQNFSLEELPDVTFTYSASSSSFAVAKNSNILFSVNYGFYIADVNQDGHFDLCYCNSKGSGILRYFTVIYDIHNEKLLLLQRKVNLLIVVLTWMKIMFLF